jgi:hypothetical protein
LDRSPFETAAGRIEAWLDQGAGSAWACRDPKRKPSHGRAWSIELLDDELPVHAVRLELPTDFPASTCELYVDRDYFLKVPHVEADGHLCLGLRSIPDDYDDPVAAIVRALGILRDQLLRPSRAPDWVRAQFHAERASYWAQYCAHRRMAADCRPLPRRTFVDLRSRQSWQAGAVAAYVPGRSKHQRFDLQVVVEAGVDPHETACRYRWADGMLVRGSALFVEMPSEQSWTPADWPRSFEALESLVARITNHTCSLVTWLDQTGWADDAPNRAPRLKPSSRLSDSPVGPRRPLLVVMVQDGVLYGFQVCASAVPRLQKPAVEPVLVERVDPDWALARDKQLHVLHARRRKRILVLGCGSLGSSLVVALARAGVGHIDLVDRETMGPENTCRHELGAVDVGNGKAAALARRLTHDIPGLVATGVQADVQTWTVQHCRPGLYDLVVECTAESSVRTFLSHMRGVLFGGCPLVHAWAEPMCSAGHVLLTHTNVPWPASDPADTLVNASDLSAEDSLVPYPACSGGFHPYGAADIALVAAFAAEKVIAALDDTHLPSTVWSWVRASAFYEALGVEITLRDVVPRSASRFDSAATTRDLAELLAKLP